MTDGTVQHPPEFLRRDSDEGKQTLARTELLLETHRVIGTLEQSGPPRRLVDILNVSDGPAVFMRDAVVESLTDLTEATHEFELVHVQREAILLAIPISASAPARRDTETVEKRPAAATLVLPGLEVTGHIHLPPDADPGAVRLLGGRDFLPVTEAEVTQLAFGFSRWRVPLVVVNLQRALLYAPAAR